MWSYGIFPGDKWTNCAQVAAQFSACTSALNSASIQVLAELQNVNRLCNTNKSSCQYCHEHAACALERWDSQDAWSTQNFFCNISWFHVESTSKGKPTLCYFSMFRWGGRICEAMVRGYTHLSDSLCQAIAKCHRSSLTNRSTGHHSSADYCFASETLWKTWRCIQTLQN